jgi:23S rRNA (adenine2503-C2)-methyltransferase
VEQSSRRVSFEWAVIDGINDRPGDAIELATLARRLGAHVNLIPLNPTSGGLSRGLRGSPRAHVLAFRRLLTDRGVNATIRQTRGQEIDAACGQLAGAGALAHSRSSGNRVGASAGSRSDR